MRKILQTIRKRLQALEQAQETVNTPECVFITWDESISHWIAIEQYMKMNARMQVIPMTGTPRRILIDNPDSYKTPIGFTGVVFIEDGLMD